jgi:acyl-CoA thioesterase-1
MDSPVEMRMKQAVSLKANDTILFIGDSITAADRHRQAYGPLGFGYVHFAGNFLLARYPTLDLKIINTGVSGDTLTDLAHRWQRDCLDHHPDVVSVLVGINDVWQRTMEPDLAENAASPDEYEVTYEQLLAQARQQCECRLVLMEPFLFSRDPRNEVLQTLGPYVEVVRRLAERYQAVLVSLQSRIDREIMEIPPERWSHDSVHPYLWAHAWIAQQWLDANGL